MLLHQVINELRHLKNTPGRRSAHEIYEILENKKQMFSGIMDPDNFRMLLKDFEMLANAPAKEYNSPGYARDYHKAYHLLMFYLEKVV
jgi:hypothetical protein